MIDVVYVNIWWIVELPVALRCPIAWFVLWLYLHRRIDGYVIDVESVHGRVYTVSEVGIVLSIVLFLWVLWIRVPIVW